MMPLLLLPVAVANKRLKNQNHRSTKAHLSMPKSNGHSWDVLTAMARLKLDVASEIYAKII